MTLLQLQDNQIEEALEDIGGSISWEVGGETYYKAESKKIVRNGDEWKAEAQFSYTYCTLPFLKIKIVWRIDWYNVELLDPLKLDVYFSLFVNDKPYLIEGSDAEVSYIATAVYKIWDEDGIAPISGDLLDFVVIPPIQF